MISKKKILLITAGGTIAGNIAIKKESAKTVEDTLNLHKVIEPSLKRIESESGRNITADLFAFSSIDSSDILPQHWTSIGSKIQKEYDNYDAFLITHGTNTLGYTSAALSFSFENLGKPVILTGSQIPLGHTGSDAL